MTEFKIEPAIRIRRLPPYLFGRLNALKLAKRQEGADIIDLGMGNPSDGAPQIVIDKLLEAAKDLFANEQKTFFRITLPLTLPGIFGAFVLVFVPAMCAFVEPE